MFKKPLKVQNAVTIHESSLRCRAQIQQVHNGKRCCWQKDHSGTGELDDCTWAQDLAHNWPISGGGLSVQFVLEINLVYPGCINHHWPQFLVYCPISSSKRNLAKMEILIILMGKLMVETHQSLDAGALGTQI